MGNIDESRLRATGSTFERGSWERDGETFVRQWTRDLVLLVRPHHSWWLVLVSFGGNTVHLSEVDGRDAAMEMAEDAALAAIHLRRFERVAR